MANIVVKRVCPQCGGDGLYGQTQGPDGGGPYPCNWTGCVEGYVELGYVELDPSISDVMDKLEDVLTKCDDILEGLG